MKAVKIGIWIFLAAVAETALSRYTAVAGIMPALVFALCVGIASAEESFGVMLAAVIAGGICTGALGSGEMWFTVLKFTYTGVLCYVMVNKLFKGKKQFFTTVIMTAAMSFAAEMMYYLVMNVGSITPMGAEAAALRVALPAAAYNTIAAAVIYKPMQLSVYKRAKNDILVV